MKPQMDDRWQSRIDEWQQRLKATRAYHFYRQSRLYDEVRRHGKRLKRRLRLRPYLGNQYQCPMCGVGLSRYKPIGKSYWRDTKKFGSIYPPSAMETFNVTALICPRCDASDRERLTAIFLQETFGTFDRQRSYRLLEFAPNEALPKLIKRYPFIAYRSADLSRKDVDERIDLTAMHSYADSSLDIILCSHVLEHIPDDRSAMREIARVLRPDGFAVLLVPLVIGVEDTHEDPSITSVALRWKYFGMGDHVRQYGKRDFLARLAGAGLRVEQLGIEHFGAEVFRHAGIAENSILYIAHPMK